MTAVIGVSTQTRVRAWPGGPRPNGGQPQYGAPQPGQSGPQYGQSPQGPQYGGQPQWGGPQQGAPNGVAPAFGAGVSPTVKILLAATAVLGLLVFISVFLPWVSGGGESYNGLADNGESLYGIWILLLGLLTLAVAAGSLFFAQQFNVLPVVSAGIAALTGLVGIIIFAVDYNKISDAQELIDKAKDTGVVGPPVDSGITLTEIYHNWSVSPGFGLWMMLVMAIGLIGVGGATLYFRQFADK